MSWLFSRALVEAFSGVTCSDGAQSALLSGSPTPQAFLPSDRMTAFSRPARFGMTFAPLTDMLGAAVLTWCQAASRARTSALQEKAPALLVSDLECGVTWRGSLAKFDPDSCSWKTAQLSLLEDLELSSVTWPASGMTASGQCWELPMLGRRTSATGSGLLPTPTVFDSIAENMMPKNGDTTKVDKFGKARKVLRDGRTASMGLARLINHDANTANASSLGSDATDLKSATAHDAKGTAPVMWPTPTVCGNYNRKGASATSGDGLATAVKFATPLAQDWRSGKASQATHDKNSPTLAMQAGGSLNPTWVEWLMGWPLGCTDLKPLATDKFQPAQPPLGES